MRTEKLLWSSLVALALFLLFAPPSGRTEWTGDQGGMRHSAGWDWVAPLSGLLVLGSLAIGYLQRPRVLGPVVCAAFAALAFGVSAAAAGGHWFDLHRGALEIGGMTVRPAPWVHVFAVAAAVGLAVTLVLLGTWLRPGEAEWISDQIPPNPTRL